MHHAILLLYLRENEKEKKDNEKKKDRTETEERTSRVYTDIKCDKIR